MKVIVFLGLLSAVYCAPRANPGAVGPPYVWDLQKPRMDAASVAAMLTQKADGQYPTYVPIPQGGFDCNSKKMPGYYADTEFQCQVYHRCDINGNMTSYICDNTTVFDQVTLICDYWFNVDCSRSQEFEEFANRRLYQEELPLFDTPPADYVAPQAQGSAGAAAGQGSKTRTGGAQQKSGGGQVAAKAKAAGGQGGASAQSSGRKAQASGQAGAGSRTAAGRSNTGSYGNAQASNAQGSAQDQAESAE
ncbi:uncharacterized protein LOC129595837 [Paramacrobiotus metropolitanus]|uniref:uncharacterized protein LOC129595837 n=1 Tax=Paramacrobiotus metropolitanus TaxID=2943436 RepID=UPI0024457D26|nr:uncharacterized protein LOC129595837 [Paramacrobiotus metropolitanus]